MGSLEFLQVAALLERPTLLIAAPFWDQADMKYLSFVTSANVSDAIWSSCVEPAVMKN